jgi:hypothetical protein
VSATGALRVLVTGVGTLIALVVTIGLFVGISALVLWSTGRLLPLAGRGRRRD